jgi:hypothetical protein
VDLAGSQSPDRLDDAVFVAHAPEGLRPGDRRQRTGAGRDQQVVVVDLAAIGGKGSLTAKGR